MKSKKLVNRILNKYINLLDTKLSNNHKKSRKEIVLTVALSAIACVLMCTYGCSSQDDTPMGSLSSSKVSDKYNYGFWMNEAKKTSSLWNSAADYCRTPTNSHNINCSNVNEINMLININTDAPTNNPRAKEFTKIPNFGH